MYEAFDDFLRVTTWYTGHPSDKARFYCALRNVVQHADFSPYRMADYFREKGRESLSTEALEAAVTEYERDAGVIQAYESAEC